ncbi:DUF4011 domain-containing protein [Hyphococcus luteus]|uniref:DUF4011 domain-containing protein n=1 Tax=Hyphococcus luteus TaxID=2058213 RepID=UPI0013FDE341|nr:DUF4011 domain-containing protein [Marinicaulis flavus]
MTADAAATDEHELEAWVRTRIEALRPRLLDLTRRNPLISTKLTPRSNSYVRVVDELPDVLAFELSNQQSMRFVPLPSLELDPKDELRPDFRVALAGARRTDEIYLEATKTIQNGGDEAQDEMRRLERELKDRVRERLDLPPRQTGADISLAQHAKLHGISPSYDLPDPSEEHQDGRHRDEDIQTLLLADDLERKMTGITTKCRTWLQETGINVLHAAFGFLEWQDDRSRSSAFAPLVLMPVGITKNKTPEGPEFWVKGLGDAGESNLVLAEMLRNDFGIDLPKFSEGSIEDYLAEVAALKPRNLKWKVRRQATFGVFPSARMAMYHDLDTSKTSFHNQELVKQLLGGADSSEDSPFADEYDVDAPEVEAKISCLVMDADSSQLSVIADIADGRNLAVEGPPGTGKSQTIVNTIASAIAGGKKILFVAEKMAALEVVKSRLESVGLGEFVLPLQAERSTREQVISSVKERMEMGAPRAAPDYESKLAQFKKVRSELTTYIDVISSPYGATGLKVYDVLGRAMWSNDMLRDRPDVFLNPPISDPESFDKIRLETLRHAGDRLDAASNEASQAAEYWRGLDIDSADRFTLEQILALAKGAKDACEAAAREREALQDFNIDPKLQQSGVAAIEGALKEIKSKIGDCDAAFIVRMAKSGVLDEIVRFHEACARYQTIFGKLKKFLTAPSDDMLAERVRRIYALCTQNDISSLDLEALLRRIESDRHELASLEQVESSLSDLPEDIAGSESLNIDAIRVAHDLIANSSPESLALRTSANANPAAALIVKQAAQTGRKLRDEKTNLEERLIIPPDLTSTELAGHAAALRDSSVFSFLSSSCRNAKRIMRTLSRAGRVKKDEGVRQLQALADWKASEAKFLADEQAKACFGMHFKGIETDFDAFERLGHYYEKVDQRLKGNGNRNLRNFLKEGDLDALLAVPELPKTQWDGKISDLSRKRAELASQTQALEAAHQELKELCNCFIAPAKMRIDALLELAKQIEANVKRKHELDSDTVIAGTLEDKFHGAVTDIEELARNLTIAQIATSNDAYADEILTQVEAGSIIPCLKALQSVQERDAFAREALEALCDRSHIPQSQITEGRDHGEVAVFLDAACSDESGLQAHAKYARARRRVDELGFGWATTALLGQEQALRGFGEIIEASVIRAMALQLMSTHGAVLDRFPGTQLDALRAKLAGLDSQIIRLAQQQLRSMVAGSANPPSGIGSGPKSRWTEMALLENETSKKQRFIAVRDLTQRARRSLQELKPCWMMSPLAVAQYLPAGEVSFDLCIIDEASQMRPEDAIGALARCSQAMIVGDTNQLPPSNFFQKMLNDGEDEDEDALVDEESILEIANSRFRPARRLRWHYRSQHSGLIRFSNELVYHNDLVIFPSASEQRADMGVSLVPVEGRYRSGVNLDEAQAIVEAAIRFMQTFPDRSLGIVTLNQKQRDLLIDEMNYALDKDRAANAYVEDWAVRNDGLESFFIKNLENVQGDERDVIFIGTVYGPEQPGGPVMQRFGPINGKAGRRRLNVLFSRAKLQIVTFSSMRPSDIRADENFNPGTYMLKRWLEYSASGVLEATDQSHASTDSDFEDYVIQQLKSMGCEPVPQVGAAGYYIDIGVKHPDWPYGYILAVECDGASYHSCRSARDRDRLRQEVLERRGWKFHRIWSTDWFNDPIREAQRLRESIEARLAELSSQRERFTPPAPPEHVLEDVQSDLAAAPSERLAKSQIELDAQTPGDPKERQAEDSAEALQTSNPSPFIEIGDQVRVRYLTGSQSTLQVIINDKLNDPDNGIISAHEPLATALLGAEQGEEIEVLVGSYVRKALIENVVKAENRTIMK